MYLIQNHAARTWLGIGAAVISMGFCALAAIANSPIILSESERIILIPPSGAEKSDLEIVRWQNNIKAPEAAIESWERLGWAYVAKARRTQDAGFYKLAEKTADAMNARFGDSDAEGLLRGSVYHNLHRFREAEDLARNLVKRRGLTFDYALLSDTLMEQGKLDEAVAACQQLVDTKPGLEGYSRIAHLRWLKGDLPGAIEAMEYAVRAADPREAESLAWVLSRVSGYYLQAGRLDAAVVAASAADKHLKNYAPALLALGRALCGLERYEQALPVLQKAVELTPLPEYQWWLADCLRLQHRVGEAQAVEEKITERGERDDPRTLVIFLATRHRDIAAAVRLASAELENRSDVLTKDAFAWALVTQGEVDRAKNVIDEALAAGTADARLFYHAGIIYSRTGRAGEARSWFEKASAFEASLTPSEKGLLHAALSSSELAMSK